MAVMTKKTVCVYDSDSVQQGFFNQNNTHFILAQDQKLGSLYAADKTDGYSKIEYKFECNGINDVLTNLMVTRFWSDQESAEEWCNFFRLLCDQFNQVPISTDIQDL